MAKLIGLDLIERAVRASLLTGRVKNSDTGPLSLLLISPPECGKTSIVMIDTETAVAFTDVTGRGILDTLQQNKDASHIILLDMVAMMSHRQSVNNYTLAMLNAMTEEGARRVSYPGTTMDFDGHGKRGLIACLTVDLVKDGRLWWNKTGFTTRLLPLAFDHSDALQRKIKQQISIETSAKEIVARAVQTLDVPANPVTVTISARLAREIQYLSDLKSIELKEKGYRRLKQFRALARGNALLSHRKIVTDVDLKFLVDLQPYISFSKAAQI